MNVAVHRVAIDDPRWASDATELSPEERARASRLVYERDRSRFVAAHKALRRILTRAIGGEPSIDVGAEGKPFVRGSDVRFNLSHAGDVALVAVSSDCDVGVDVERVRAVEATAIAERMFSVAERAALARAADTERAFFRGWTRKEAFVKLVGAGLGMDLCAFDVSLDPHPERALIAVRTGSTRATIVPLAIDEGYEAALAAAADSVHIARFDERP